jgi:hypothetical protein
MRWEAGAQGIGLHYAVLWAAVHRRAPLCFFLSLSLSHSLHPSPLSKVLAASGPELELDLADWARPFEFHATLWSVPPGASRSFGSPARNGGSWSPAAPGGHGKGGFGGRGAGQFCDQGRLYRELGAQLVDSLFQVGLASQTCTFGWPWP